MERQLWPTEAAGGLPRPPRLRDSPRARLEGEKGGQGSGEAAKELLIGRYGCQAVKSFPWRLQV